MKKRMKNKALMGFGAVGGLSHTKNHTPAPGRSGRPGRPRGNRRGPGSNRLTPAALQGRVSLTAPLRGPADRFGTTPYPQPTRPAQGLLGIPMSLSLVHGNPHAPAGPDLRRYRNAGWTASEVFDAWIMECALDHAQRLMPSRLRAQGLRADSISPLTTGPGWAKYRVADHTGCLLAYLHIEHDALGVVRRFLWAAR